MRQYELTSLDSDSAFRRRIRHYVAPTLFVIDEVGYLSYSTRHADLLFELINRRHEQKGTLITTNKSFSEWVEVFPNADCVVALIDRLVHNAEIIALKGQSYRRKEAKERAEQKARKRKEKNQELRMKQYPQPSGLQFGLKFLIASEWTPEQAYAVFQLLDDLRERILANHQVVITEKMREECGADMEPCQYDNPYLWSDENTF